jgi:hypothetical protein
MREQLDQQGKSNYQMGIPRMIHGKFCQLSTLKDVEAFRTRKYFAP